MELNPPIIKRGKLMTSGTSTTVAIPREWLKEKGLGAGDDIILVANGDLKIMKLDEESVNKLKNQLVSNDQGVTNVIPSKNNTTGSDHTS